MLISLLVVWVVLVVIFSVVRVCWVLLVVSCISRLMVLGVIVIVLFRLWGLLIVCCIIVWVFLVVSGCSCRISDCDSSGVIIENDGFLVVVVINSIIWCFIVDSRVFCWVLENWCILLMNSMVCLL